MTILTRNTSKRITTALVALVFSLTVFSTPAFCRPPRPFHGGGHHHVHGGDGWLLLPAILTTVVLAGMTLSAINNAPSAPPPPANTPVVVMSAPSVAAGPNRIAVTSTVVVTAALLNLRSGPSLTDPSMHQLAAGTPLSVYGSVPGWYYVRTPENGYGWVMNQYTVPAMQANG